jgi:hypothetical protein
MQLAISSVSRDFPTVLMSMTHQHEMFTRGISHKKSQCRMLRALGLVTVNKPYLLRYNTPDVSFHEPMEAYAYL